MTGMEHRHLAFADNPREVVEETWNCPNCGKPATAFVSVLRVIACGSCRWTFEVSLGKHYGLDEDLYASACQRAVEGAVKR